MIADQEAVSSTLHPQSSVLPKTVKVVHGTVTGTDGKALANRPGDVLLGQDDGFLDRFPFGQIGGNGGGKSAACAMGVASADTGRAKRANFLAIEKQVYGRPSSMAALDNDILCAHRNDPARRFFDFPDPG